MKKYVLITAVVFAFMSLMSCAMVMSPAMGTLYTDVKAPLAVTSESNSSKTGRAECVSILGIVANGDCSIDAAMRDGKITKVSHVDYQSKNILGVYAAMTTIVYGN